MRGEVLGGARWSWGPHRGREAVGNDAHASLEEEEARRPWGMLRSGVV